jgi:diaminopimelate epimerase
MSEAGIIMRLAKYSANGNDYLVVRPQNRVRIDKIISRICDRHRGIGADGILVGPYSDGDSPPLVRIYNSDGTETSKSGNGVCIFARFLVDEGLVASQTFPVRTLSGPVTIQEVDTISGLVRTTMGSYSLESGRIPVRGPERRVINERLAVGGEHVEINCISFGNPHCVIFLPDVSHQVAERLGPLVSTHKIFPEGINVQFVKVLGNRDLALEIWERGSGYTLASGSSSCAAAFVAFSSGRTGRTVNVHTPGGHAKVEIREDNEVILETTVTPVFRGSLRFVSF